MTRQDFSNLACQINNDWADPWTEEKETIWNEHMEQVREALVAEYSKNPLYQERAAKNPRYWDNFSMGQVNLLQRSAKQVYECREELLASAKARRERQAEKAASF